MGKFIVIEGIDGVGKSTAIKALKDLLPQDTVYTREPGGTHFAETVRDMMLNYDTATDDVGRASWVYAICAARYDHLTKVILPALSENKLVICDRYALSTMMYQCVGDIHATDLLTLSLKLNRKWFGAKSIPTMTIILDGTNEMILERKKSAEEANRYDSLDVYSIDKRRGQMQYAKQMYQSILGDTIRNVYVDSLDTPSDVARKINTLIKE